ncbi:replication initiator protein [Apis mellifera associated microvirus 9]|nr:replication initiator protein [Apis mellifera associated microvirus 9]
MSCLYPVSCYRAIRPNENGTRPLAHTLRQAVSTFGADGFAEATRSCGNCIECRLKKSRFTAVRCVHQASMFSDNCFITLTYDDDHFPSAHSVKKKDGSYSHYTHGSLCTDHLQKFWKRLRKEVGRSGIKYFAVGEYGDGKGERFRINSYGERVGANPHYHACVFSYDFPDKKICGKNERGDLYYESALLTDLWGKGRALLGDVTFESAAYCARYTLKKVYGDKADGHYDGLMPERPYWSTGLGKAWFEKWSSDIYPSDQLVTRDGRVMTPPPYYDRLLLAHNPSLYEDVKNAREKIIISKNNFDLVRDPVHGRTMSVSEIVRRAQLRVGRLDAQR